MQVQLSCVAERETALREREERMNELEGLLASTQESLTHYIEQEVQRRLKVCVWGLGLSVINVYVDAIPLLSISTRTHLHVS